MNIDVTANEMVAEHAAGVGYRGIGARHGLSHEGARRVVMSQGTALINEVELAAFVARCLHPRDTRSSMGGGCIEAACSHLEAAACLSQTSGCIAVAIATRRLQPLRKF